MKAIRFVFYGSLPVFFLLGLYTGQRFFHLLFLVGLLLLGAALALNVYTFTSFKYTQALTQRICQTSDRPILHMTLFNENPFPLSVLRIRVALASAAQPLVLTFSLEPKGAKSFQIPLDLPFCGSYLVGMTTLVITDVFGLLPMAFSMHHLAYYKMKELIVLPTAYPLDALSQKGQGEPLSGQAAFRLTDQGDGYAQLRGYRPGDPRKRIHWKKSAQQQTLLVKQDDLPEQQTERIWIDTAALTGSKAQRLAKRHTLCEAAATLVRRLLEQHKAVHIRLIGAKQPDLFYRSVADLDRFRLKLATLPFEGHEDALIQELASAAQVKALTCLTAQALKNQSQALARIHGLLLLVIGQKKTPSPVRTLVIPTGGDIAAALTAGDLP